MNVPAPGTITVQATMTRDDYASYFSVMQQRQASRKNSAGYAVVLFAAIPTALAGRALGLYFGSAPADADLIGKCSLASFLIGVFAIIVAGFITRRLAIRDQLGATLNAFAPKTVSFDATGVTMTGSVSESRWRWPAISGLTTQQGLVLVWIAGSSALAIPDRCFAGPAEREAALAYVRERLSGTAASASPAA